MDLDWRDDREREARVLTTALAQDGVEGVALCYVDNAGLTRVKTVPLAALPHAAAWGVGMSPVFDVFAVDDSITTGRLAGGPTGDLRLHPDLDRLVRLAAQPGWAWAPVDRYTQDGEVHPGCQRGFARRAAARAAEAGLDVRMGFETEWVVGHDVADEDGGGAGDGDGAGGGAGGRVDDGGFRAACRGPAYGMTRVVELSDYGRDLLAALAAESVEVLQLHPEYAAGQFELSTAPRDPVAAADEVLLVRETVRAVSARHGLAALFAPVVVAGLVGNGQHLHLSLHRDGLNLLDGGEGRYRLTGEGESFLAGVLAALPALTAVLAPSVASHLRLVPSRWAGAYRCWGRENREAALRLVTGATGETHAAANAEVKCVDASANPYLAVGAVLTVGVAALDKGLTLPAEVSGDPAALEPATQQRLGLTRLPETVDEALARLAGCELLKEAMGEYLYDAFTAVRRAEAALFADRTPEQVAATTRWRY